MSTAKENPCRKFQANIFNKSKCQNCFKPRELHLLTDQDLTQAKPIYGGWLCLAPEGTDFDNPMQRSRKWQRRFFVLYEHGCLRFALDESRSTLPQGTVNMNLCTDVIDAEPKTGQKNALCIITPEQEYFIRGENKEIINGWSEQLVIYPKTNKQNQKKKRKVEPATTLEPGPAKVAVTGSGIPEADPGPDSSSIIWQEELSQREVDGATVWSATDLSPLGSLPPPAGDAASVGSDAGSLNGDEVDRAATTAAPALGSALPYGDPLSPTGSCSSLGGVPRCPSPAPSDPFPSGSSLLSNGSHISGSLSSLDSDASGSTVTSNDSHPAAQRGAYPPAGLHHDTPRARRLEAEARKAEKRSRARSPERRQRPSVLSPERSRSAVIEKLEALELENAEKMEVEEAEVEGREARQGRSEHRRFNRQGEDPDFPSTRPPLRRAKSLDRRTTDSVMTPDLLNFKKGWMVKLEEHGQWKKYWFVLTDHSLRYYKDSIAEEASDLDGEIELSTCYNVTEYQAQRNYGFQIHTQEGVHTLSAMTAGIRRNWIQAVMKNVRPSTAPDVASSTDDHGAFTPLDGLVRPDVTQDSPCSSEASSVAAGEREAPPGLKKSRALERRRGGRSKTFDWAEFRPIAQALAQQRAQQEAEDGLSGDAADPERSRRREERRRRYDTAAGPPAADEAGRMDCESVAVASVAAEAAGANPTERRQRVEEVIEQHWQQVEKTPLREEKRVPLPAAPQPRDTAELEKLLESYKKGVDDLKTQLEGCHQQLVDSSQHKQELEVQLRTALEREHDVRSGYISPLENPMGLEADLAPHTTRAELVSSQAQSLTKKYQETKELLQLQELKKRNMQAQLGLSLSHLVHADPCASDPPRSPPSEGPPPEPVQKTVSFVLSDSAEGIQELEDLITGRPVSLHGLQRLLQSHSCSQERGEQGHYQKLLARWKHQQDVENETIKKSLLRAGESIRDYETRLLTMEDMVGKAQRQTLEGPGGSCGPLLKTESETTNDLAIGMLSQRLELLTGENGALNQRYQEIVNQLTEADREIDRLKAELAKLQAGKQQRLLEEELARVKAEVAENQAVAIDREYYERELNERSLRLHEALVTLEELGNTLRDTEKKLQLREATLKGLGFQAAAAFEEDEGEDEMRLSVGQLKELLEASEAKLFENEAIIKSAEQRCSELEAQKCELMIQKEESEKVVIQKLREAGDEIRMLQERVGKEVKAGRDEPTMHVGKEAMQTCETQVVEAGLLKQVVDDIGMKSDALSAVVEMFGHVDMDVEKIISDLKSTLLVTDYLCSSQEEMITVNQKRRERLVLEAEFWGHLLTIKDSGKDSAPDFGRHVAVRVMAERSLLFLTRRLCPRANADENCDAPVTEADFSAMFTWLDKSTNALIFEELRQTLEEKANILKQIVTTIDLSKDDELRSLALKTFNCEGHQKRPSEYLLDALKDAYMLYVTIRLQLESERDRMHTHAAPQSGSVDCGNCPKLREINRELNSKLVDLQTSLSGATVGDAGGPLTRIQIEGEPVDPLDKTIELQDMIARHRKELRDVKDAYEQEAETLRRQVVKAGEALHLRSEENVREIDSLTACMETLKRKHDAERNVLLERFEGEMEELRSAAAPLGPAPGATDGSGDAPSGLDPSQTLDLKERIQQLVAQVSAMTGEMSRRERQGGATALRMKYEKDLENLKATCERGFAAMEESHQKVIEELQRKHQRELENLQEDKDRLLAEETAATIAAIEAMRNAHRSELEKELDKARKTNNHAENADLDEIHRQHEEELCSFQREIEVLSEQYSQKCLENAHLAQALEAERQALRQCQRENQELNAHNQELNNRLAAEITKMRSMASEEGESGVSMHGKELYELEVMLRVKESEVQYLKQEINSLKEELQAAQRDKKYATDKYKDIYTELSIVKAKAERDLGRLRDQLQLAHEALGEPSLEEVERGGYDIMKSKSNPDILKMAAAAAKRSERTLRSKSLKEGLTAEQRLHLFDNKDAKEF